MQETRVKSRNLGGLVCNYVVGFPLNRACGPLRAYWTFLHFPCMVAGVDGTQIRAAREARGWTQEDLAREVGVGSRTIGNWERGETIPKNRLGRLVEIFGEGTSDPVRAASDVELLSELLRRAAARARGTA